MSRFDAVIFDLDGTLIDTEAQAIRAGLEAFRAMGITDPGDIFHRLVGTDQPTGRGLLHAAFPDLDIDRLTRLWQQGFETEIRRDLPLKPGAVELLGRIDRPKALCTSSEAAAAHHKLQLAGLAPHFSVVTTLACVTRAKPDPEPYALTAARLGVAPERCLVFEDSEPGAAAAFAAGCIVVQVPDVIPASGDYAHHVAPTLMEGARMAGLFGPA